MYESQKKGLIILGVTNFSVFLLFFIPFLLTNNQWFLVASLVNILALVFIIYLIIKFNKEIKRDGQE